MAKYNIIIMIMIKIMRDILIKYELYNIKDIPIGFGTTAKSAVEFKDGNPNMIVIYNQSDAGEYLRIEDEN